MKNLNQKMQAQFNAMCATGKLFRVQLTGREIWDLYLASFDVDPIFRSPESTTHNCNLCNNFIRRYGNVVAIDSEYNLMSIFDFDIEGEFSPVVQALSIAIKASKIENVFFEHSHELLKLSYEKQTSNREVYRLGIEKNLKRYTKEEAELFPGVVKANQIVAFEHLYLDLPKQYVLMGHGSIESEQSNFRSAKEVFQRGLTEIPIDTLVLVSDLIKQGSLLDGNTHIEKVKKMIELANKHINIPMFKKDNWYWATSYKLASAKFKNELIGVLCTELAEGMDLNAACQNWNKRVDPANYMKVTAPITQKQIQEAEKFVVDNNYVESFDRRFATIDDIKVSEILHSNVGNGEIKNVSIFADIKATSTRHKRAEFDGVEEIPVDKFMSDILPTCTAIEAFLTNDKEGNLVSLTTANVTESKPIFKWNNNYSWTFKGNLAGKSQIKEEVKSKGGKVDGVLRFSMMWADGNGDNSDLDLHAVEPSGNEISYLKRLNTVTGGNLDIDITQPNGRLSVENITWPSLARMKDGIYRLFVRQYAARSSKGFKAEIEFNGELYSYDYPRPVSGDVQIALVTLKAGVFTIEHKLPATDGVGVSREIYGLETNKFHKVNLVCLSPNHWSDNQVGNKHFMFMIDGCQADDDVRTFHNENLSSELLEHKRVLEVLGMKAVAPAQIKQLSGLGFNATVRDELIVKLSGSHKRVVRIKF